MTLQMTTEQAIKACGRFMSQWDPEEDEEDDTEEPYDPYEFGDSD